MRLCKDCKYCEDKKHMPHTCNNCLYRWPCPVTGETTQTNCRYARWSQSLCGYEAMKFEPKILTGWVTLKEWIDAGNDAEAFKAAWNACRHDSVAALIRYGVDPEWQPWRSVLECEFNFAHPDCAYQIHIDENGNLPKPTPKPSIIPGDAPAWMPWRARDYDGPWYAFQNKPRASGRSWNRNGGKVLYIIPDFAPTYEVDWKKSLFDVREI